MCVYIYMHALRGIIVLSVVVWYQCCPKYWSTSERFYSALCKIRRHFGAALGECTIPGVEVCSKNLQMQDSRRIFCGNHKVDSARFRYSVLHNFILQESNCILANLLTRICCENGFTSNFYPWIHNAIIVKKKCQCYQIMLLHPKLLYYIFLHLSRKWKRKYKLHF